MVVARKAGASRGCGAIMGKGTGPRVCGGGWGRKTKHGVGLDVQRSFNLSIMGRQGRHNEWTMEERGER